MKKKTTVKAKPSAEKNAVITMVVDESGSMNPVWDATIIGFNEYVSSLKSDLKGKSYFSAITFDTRGIRKLQTGAPIKDAIVLTKQNYVPSGGTPLLDAIGAAIKATDEVNAKEKCNKQIVVIQTDGEENASREYNLASIKQMIEERQGKGWQFVFIGAGINAFLDGVKMGITAINTVSYSKDINGTRAMFRATAGNTSGLIHGLNATMAYSAEQSAAVGECASITRAKMAHTDAKPVAPVPGFSPINDLSLTS